MWNFPHSKCGKKLFFSGLRTIIEELSQKKNVFPLFFHFPPFILFLASGQLLRDFLNKKNDFPLFFELPQRSWGPGWGRCQKEGGPAQPSWGAGDSLEKYEKKVWKNKRLNLIWYHNSTDFENRLIFNNLEIPENLSLLKLMLPKWNGWVGCRIGN